MLVSLILSLFLMISWSESSPLIPDLAEMGASMINTAPALLQLARDGIVAIANDPAAVTDGVVAITDGAVAVTDGANLVTDGANLVTDGAVVVTDRADLHFPSSVLDRRVNSAMKRQRYFLAIVALTYFALNLNVGGSLESG